MKKRKIDMPSCSSFGTGSQPDFRLSCANCSQSCLQYIESTNETSSCVYEIIVGSRMSNGTSARVNVDTALSLIYKVNVVNQLNSSSNIKKEDPKDDEGLVLCINCGNMMTDLMTIYTAFNEARQHGSYLSKKIGELDQLLIQLQETWSEIAIISGTNNSHVQNKTTNGGMNNNNPPIFNHHLKQEYPDLPLGPVLPSNSDFPEIVEYSNDGQNILNHPHPHQEQQHLLNSSSTPTTLQEFNGGEILNLYNNIQVNIDYEDESEDPFATIQNDVEGMYSSISQVKRGNYDDSQPSSSSSLFTKPNSIPSSSLSSIYTPPPPVTMRQDDNYIVQFSQSQSQDIIMDSTPARCKNCFKRFMCSSHLDMHMSHCPSLNNTPIIPHQRSSSSTDVGNTSSGGLDDDSDGSDDVWGGLQRGRGRRGKRKTGRIEKYKSCPICPGNVSFEVPSELSQHFYHHHLAEGSSEPSLTCLLCHNKFSIGHSLKVHLKSHAGDLRWACSYSNCKRFFLTKQQLDLHSQVHKNGDDIIIGGDGKSKRSNDAPSQRWSRANPVQIYDTCPLCPPEMMLKFENKAHLSEHWWLQHGPLRSTDYKSCPLCFREFTMPTSVRTHLRAHANDKRFGCSVPQCGKLFLTKQLLENHQNRLHPLSSTLSTAPISSTSLIPTTGMSNDRVTTPEDDDVMPLHYLEPSIKLEEFSMDN